jgi:hypothetical protein
MAGKKFTIEDKKDEFKDLQESTKAADKANKKPNSDYIRLDLKPFGYDLKDYADKKAAALSIERGRRISTTAFIQELIIADMEKDTAKGKKKETKRDKVATFLENLDDKKLSALATLLDIQL